MHPVVKRTLERLLVVGAVPAGRLRTRGRSLVLSYHGIAPDGAPRAGNGSLQLARAAFAAQLDALVGHVEVVPLAALSRPAGGRPRVAITFDDGYVGAVRHGVEELATRGLPATIFVAPGRLGGHAFWWDVLAGATGEFPAHDRGHVLTALAGRDESVRRWAEGRFPADDALPPWLRSATEDELRAALRHDGITLGAHGWSHANMAALPPDELRAELARPLAWLRERFPAATVPWLAYPYGLESPDVRRAARDAGYEGALRIEGGWFDPAAGDAFGRPRFNVAAGLSLEGFLLRANGVLA